MPENIEPLLYWVHERESIRIKKAAGEPEPWTSDEILTTYRFCNVRRADDRVSSWLRANVLTPANLKKAGVESFLMFSAWCRWCNWPPTIEAAMDAGFFPQKEIDWKKLGAFVDKLGKKQKVWTGAYMIRASKKKGDKKGRFIAAEVIGKHFRKLLPELKLLLSSRNVTYETVWELLQTAPNFGSFMAGQIAGDWTYTKLLQNARDLTTWAPMGPGSIRGFNRLMGITPLRKRPPQELWNEKLSAWRTAVVERLGAEYENVTALDVQNCLCETDKFLRVKNGEGRPRARYQPHTY